jgi:hypothetical protein
VSVPVNSPASATPPSPSVSTELTGVSSTAESLCESYSELTGVSSTAESLCKYYSELIGVSYTAESLCESLFIVQ